MGKDIYRALFDEANDCILVYDPSDMRIVDVNAAVTRLYGYSREELIGRVGPLSPGEPPYSLEDGLAWLEKARTEGPQVIEWPARRKDGSRFWAEVTLKALTAAGRVLVIAVVRDVTERKLAEDRAQEQERRTRRYNQALSTLASRLRAAPRGIWGVVRQVTEVSARTLEVERVSVWLMDKRGTSIRCVDLYHLSTQTHTHGTVLFAADHPEYFHALKASRVIAAEDALNHATTKSLAASYLAPLGITSMLDAPIRVAGRVFGVVCHEHVGAPRRWSLDDQAFVGSVADLLSLAFEAWQHMRAERAWRRSERRFRELAALLPDIIYETDPEFRFTYANDAALRLLGYTEKDFASGLTIHDVLEPSEAENAARRLQEAAKTGQPTVGVYRLKRKEGGEILCEVHSVAYFDERGQVAGYRGVARDIRERQRIEEAQRMAAVGRIAAGVAHEFNNILAAVVGRAELAQSSQTIEAYEKLAQTAIQAGLRGAEICRGLMQFARPSEPKRQPVAVEDPIEAALAMAESELRRANVTVRRSYRSENMRVFGDPRQLQQVFLNLILNACDAMAPNGGVLSIETSYVPAKTGEQLVVRVSDTGSGIAPEHLPLIFEPFFTTKTAEQSSNQLAAGLGLAVSRSIVLAHAGTIEVESSPGHGTTFTVRLPVAQEQHEEHAQAAQDASRPRPPLAGCKRLLLVEDDPAVGDVIRDVLAAEGLEVMLVRSTEEALAKLEDEKFDLVVADLVMAGGGARSILKRLPHLPWRPAVVAITGLSDAAIETEMLRLGASACLRKPFTATDLLSAVQKAVGEAPPA